MPDNPLSIDTKVRMLFDGLRKRQRRDLKPFNILLPSKRTFSLKRTSFYARSGLNDKFKDFELDRIEIKGRILTGACQSIYRIAVSGEDYAFCIHKKPHQVYHALGWTPDDLAGIEGLVPVYGLITVNQKRSEVYGGVICDFVGKGITLQDYVHENEIDDDYLRVALSSTKRILHAINGLKEAGLVHEDIKPTNIMLTNDECPIAYLGDFDLMHNQRFGSPKIGEFYGTVPFIPLEKIWGTSVDYRSDLFSWTVCLGKAVKINYFFQNNEGLFHLLERIKHQKVLPPKSRLSHLPGELIEPVHELLRIGLSTNIEDRNIDEMIKLYQESDIKEYVYC